MDFLTRNWPAITSAAAGLLAVAVALVDAETTRSFGLDFDRGAFYLGLGLLGGTSTSLIRQTLSGPGPSPQ